jgi:hypothetical protein
VSCACGSLSKELLFDTALDALQNEILQRVLVVIPSSRPQAIRLLGEGAVSAKALTEDGLPQ